MYLADAHCDTITKVLRRNEELYGNNCHISLEKLSAYDSPVIFFAIFLNKENNVNLFNKALEVYDFLMKQAEKNSDSFIIAKSKADVLKSVAEGKITAVPAIEGGEILEGKIANLFKFHEMGIKYITLTWNYENEIASPAALNGAGLKPFGRDLIKEMNELDILVDVSHLSEKGFWDVCAASDKPFMASHSNSKSLCGHFRNLTDSQLKALGERGGFAGINLNPPFLTDSGSAGIDDVCRHAEHMLEYAGEDAVGLGTDFDGIGSVPEELEDVSRLSSLYRVFTEKFGERIAKKIFFENLMRLLK